MSDVSVTHEIESRLVVLEGDNPRERDLAAEEIGDLLERGIVDLSVLEETVSRIIATAIAEDDEVAKESMFNTLAIATVHQPQVNAPWNDVADSLESLSHGCLSHALLALGNSGADSAPDAIRRYLTHPKQEVREEAQAAIDEWHLQRPS